MSLESLVPHVLGWNMAQCSPPGCLCYTFEVTQILWANMVNYWLLL